MSGVEIMGVRTLRRYIVYTAAVKSLRCNILNRVHKFPIKHGKKLMAVENRKITHKKTQILRQCAMEASVLLAGLAGAYSVY